MRSAAQWNVLGIAATPLLLAAPGVTHPQITPATAPYGYTLHPTLVLFPLLGTHLWWLLSGFLGWPAWTARALGLVYTAFYGALDVLAGIGTGLVVRRAPDAKTLEISEKLCWLFVQGDARS